MQRVSIILPISRKDYLAQVFAYLELMNCDRGNTRLIAIVDGDDDLFVDARNRVELSKFSERLCVKYVDNTGEDKTTILGRRKRISDIHNQIKQYIGDCDFIFGIEDDTLVPKHALDRLLFDFVAFPHAGFIQGVELGRWGTTYVGAWKTDDIYNPSRVTSIPAPEENVTIQEIDSGGFYCFLTRRENYMLHTFEPFMDNALGPDADFGIALRQLGHMNYIDWTINCVHRNGDLSLSYPKYPIQRIEFFKIGENWRQKLLKN